MLVLTVVAECFCGEHFSELHNVGVRDLLPDINDRHTFGVHKAETFKH